MKFIFRKDIFIFLLIAALFSFFGAGTLVLEAFYPFKGIPSGIFWIGYLILALYLFLHGVLCIDIALRMRHLDAQSTTKRLAIFQFSGLPIVFLLLAIMSLGFQGSYLEWVYYINIASLSLIAVFNTFVSIYVSRKVIAHNNGFVLVRSTSSMAITFSLALLIIYAATPIKVLTMINAGGFDPEKFIENPFYFILTEVLTLFLIVVISLIMLFIGITCYLTSKEGRLVDYRHNLDFTRRTLRKYHVGFWFGIVFTLILFMTALVSSFSFFTSYISLAALYASLLLIRLPTFFYERYLHKKYIDNPMTYFTKIHAELIYASVILILYTIVIVFFGVISPTKMNNPPSIYIVLFFLAPLNVTRAIGSSIRYYKARTSKDPNMLTRTCTDIIVAVFAIVNTLIILGSLVHNDALIIVGAIFSVLMVMGCIGIDVFLIVVGIKGLKNNRRNQMKKFVIYYENKQKEEKVYLEKEKELQGSLAKS